MRKYFVYITTNPGKSVLYIGITNDLSIRLMQHYEARGSAKSFAGRNYCHRLIYFETFQFVQDAIAREKQLKGWSRAKKEALINETNPEWRFLNEGFIEQ